MALLLLKKRKLELQQVKAVLREDNDHNFLDQLHVVTPRHHQRLRMRQILDFSTEARMVCTASAPFSVVFANKAWTTLTSFGSHEVMGKSVCNILINHAPSEKEKSASKENAFILKMLQEAHKHTVSSCLHNFYSKTKDNVPFKGSLVVRPIFSTDMYGFEVLSHFLICMFDFVSKPSMEIGATVTPDPIVQENCRRESPVTKAMRRTSSFGALSDLTEHEYTSQICSIEQLVSRSSSFHEENNNTATKPSDTKTLVHCQPNTDQESIALTLLALKHHNESSSVFLESSKPLA